MNWAEPIAYGALQLNPRSFEELQPHEFYKLIEGYIWRKKEAENKTAYFLAHLINAQGTLKKPVTPKDLLAPLRPDEIRDKRKEDAEYLRKLFPNDLK